MVCIWVPFSGRMDGLGDTGRDLHWHSCGSIPSHSFVADSNWKKLISLQTFSSTSVCDSRFRFVLSRFTLNAGARQHREPSPHFAQRCTIRDTKCGPNWLH